ncbi:MAG: MerR family transcriptional regulator [Deltaproteobacteria bacterium]|nr:MerR family transcriptional regulator [Deltaproteobacteria bacterium]
MENLGRKLLLNIDQVSKLTGVRKSTLRYWEKCFPEFLKPERTPSRRREYRMEDLTTIDTIKRLLMEEHLTNQGVKVRLRKLTAPGRAEAGSDTREG